MRSLCLRHKKKCYGFISVAVLIAGLSYLGFFKPPFPLVYFSNTNVTCLPKGHDSLELSWKMNLKITVDGVPESIPANIGNTMRCVTELHTHQNDGVVYLELYEKDHVGTLSLKDFFAVWGVPVERDGFTLTIHANKKPVARIDDIPLRDGSVVEMFYASSKNAGVEPINSTP